MGLVVMVMGVDDCVALAAGDQPAVDRECCRECDHERRRETPPEERVAQASVDGPGTARMNALSTISMTPMGRVSEVRARGMTVASASPARSRSRLVSV